MRVFSKLNTLAIVALAMVLSMRFALPSEAQTRPFSEPLIVTAQQLLADYKANELKADSIYKGKQIQLSGTIGKISKEFSGEPAVEVKGNGYLPVLCVLENPNEAMNLLAGQTVTLVGTGDGIVGVPHLKNSHIINSVADKTAVSDDKRFYSVEYLKSSHDVPPMIVVTFFNKTDNATVTKTLNAMLKAAVDAHPPTEDLITFAYLHNASTDSNYDATVGDPDQFPIYRFKEKKIESISASRKKN